MPAVVSVYSVDSRRLLHAQNVVSPVHKRRFEISGFVDYNDEEDSAKAERHFTWLLQSFDGRATPLYYGEHILITVSCAEQTFPQNLFQFHSSDDITDGAQLTATVHFTRNAEREVTGTVPQFYDNIAFNETVWLLEEHKSV